MSMKRTCAISERSSVVGTPAIAVSLGPSHKPLYILLGGARKLTSARQAAGRRELATTQLANPRRRTSNRSVKKTTRLPTTGRPVRDHLTTAGDPPKRSEEKIDHSNRA